MESSGLQTEMEQAKSQKRLLLGQECDSGCELGNLHAESNDDRREKLRGSVIWMIIKTDVKNH